MSVIKPAMRPSSPRRFFARIYGHLESEKDEEIKKDQSPERPEINCVKKDENIARLEEDKEEEMEEEKNKVDNEELSVKKREDTPSSGLPFMNHELFTGSILNPFHHHLVAQVRRQPMAIPMHHHHHDQHLHELTGHAPVDTHFHGFTAFRKYIICTFLFFTLFSKYIFIVNL